ncbi:MAG: hypothetical protein ACREA4_01980 [Nitrososphaera sp.]
MNKLTPLFLAGILVTLLTVSGLAAVDAHAQAVETPELPPITPVQAINDRTLSIVVLGTVLGSIAINLLGYEHTRNKNPSEKYDWSQLIKTLLFAVPVGTLLATTSTTLLQIDVGDSTIQTIILFMQAVVFAMGSEWWKQRTAN